MLKGRDRNRLQLPRKPDMAHSQSCGSGSDPLMIIDPDPDQKKIGPDPEISANPDPT